MKYPTTTGSIEPIKTSKGVLIRILNKSTNHEVGITIPKSHITSFLRRWFYIGSHESIGVMVKDNKILLTITVDFKHEQHIVTSVSRSTWSQIESEIKEMTL